MLFIFSREVEKMSESKEKAENYEIVPLYRSTVISSLTPYMCASKPLHK
jgi:hypothetical protein